MTERHKKEQPLSEHQIESLLLDGTLTLETFPATRDGLAKVYRQRHPAQGHGRALEGQLVEHEPTERQS